MRHRLAGMVHALAEALHHQLLQVGRQQAQALVVGQHGMGGVALDIAVPHREQGMPERQVRFRRGLEEMPVHGLGTGQHGVEAVLPQGQQHREAHRRPQRVAAAHPVPHRQHTGRIDAEGLGLRHVGAHRVQTLATAQPVAHQRAIEQGLLGAEALGDEDGRGARWIEAGQQPGGGMGIDIAEEVQAEAAIAEIAQGVHRQPRTEIGAADADVDDIGDLAGPQGLGQRPHPGAGGRGLGGGLRGYRRLEDGAQGTVQGRAALRAVDLLAMEKRPDGLAHATGTGHGEQCLQSLVIDVLAGEAGIEAVHPQGHARGPARIGRQQLLQLAPGEAGAMGLQMLQPRCGGFHSGSRTQAACAGMLWLVWVRRFCRST
ncbi:MAG: hypothetical protein KatS3mg127_0816 [Silanimonas sp.]|nr:MAG: hypothetical protein KatS3mg127_0816 [Silanimonas sp.]